MAESTLGMTYGVIKAHVGYFLEHGRTEADWTTEQLADIVFAIQMGYRQFLFPPIPPGQKDPYYWSFIRRYATLSASAGTASYVAPDDFQGILVNAQLGGSSAERLTIITEDQYRNLSTLDTSLERGQPKYIASQVSQSNPGTTGMRYNLLLHPTPDASYTYQYCYVRAPDQMSGTAEYPVGGAKHLQLLLESCLSAAELYIKDEVNGNHTQKFMAMLAGAIAVDQAENKTEALMPWPVRENEPATLDLMLDEIRHALGRYAQFGNDPRTWTEDQRKTIDELINSGWSQLKTPPPIQGQTSPHVWSWLTPIAQLVLSDGAYIYDLPNDFQTVLGELTFAVSFGGARVVLMIIRATNSGAGAHNGTSVANAYSLSEGIAAVNIASLSENLFFYICGNCDLPATNEFTRAATADYRIVIQGRTADDTADAQVTIDGGGSHLNSKIWGTNADVNYYEVRNITTQNGDEYGVIWGGNNTVFYQCQFNDCAIGLAEAGNAYHVLLVECQMDDCSSEGIHSYYEWLHVDSFASDCDYGFFNAGTFIRCGAGGCQNNGFDSKVFTIHCTADNNGISIGHGILISSGEFEFAVCAYSLSTNNTNGYGYVLILHVGELYYCGDYGNLSGRKLASGEAIFLADVGDPDIQTDPYVDSSGGDYSLNGDSVGGYLAQNVSGLLLPPGITRSYHDMGMAQKAGPHLIGSVDEFTGTKINRTVH